MANASCGLCGKTTLDQLEVDVRAGRRRARARRGRSLLGLPERLRAAQTVFEPTGGLHAAGCFGADGDAAPSCARTSAVTTRSTRSSGWATFERRLPLADQVLVVSGRVSFEIVQKARGRGHPDHRPRCRRRRAWRSRPAARFGQTVVGFVRDGRANVYTRPERIELGA